MIARVALTRRKPWPSACCPIPPLSALNQTDEGNGNTVDLSSQAETRDTRDDPA